MVLWYFIANAATFSIIFRRVGHAVRKAAQRLRESKPKSFQKIKDKYANFWAKQLDDSTSNKLSSGNLSAASSDSSSGEKKPKANKRKLAHQSSFSDQHIAMAPSTSLREGSSLDTAKILDQTADLIQQGTTSQPLCGVGLSSQLPAGLAATGAGAGFRLSSLGASGLLLSAQGASASGDVLGAARNLDDSAHGGISSAASLGSQSSNISTFLRNQVRRPSAGPSSSLSSIPINQVDMLTNSHRMQQLLQHRQALIHGTSLLGPLGTAAATGSSEGTTSLPAASMLSQLISQQRQQQSASTADRDLLLLQALQQQQRARAATTESLRQSMIQDILAGGGSSSSQDVIQEQQRLLAARLGRPSSGDPTNMMSSSASTQDLQRLLDLQNALRGGTAMTTPRGTDLPTAASVTTAMMFPPSSTSSSQQQPQDLMSQRLLQYQTLLQGAGASSNLNPATTHGEEEEEPSSKKKQKQKEDDNDNESDA